MVKSGCEQNDKKPYTKRATRLILIGKLLEIDFRCWKMLEYFMANIT